MQIHIPTVVQGMGGGGGGWSPPRVFDMLQYLNDLPSVESLWSSLQDEGYIIAGAANGGPLLAVSWILPRIRNQVKTMRNGNFLVLK